MLYQIVFLGLRDPCAKNLSELEVINLHAASINPDFWRDVKRIAAQRSTKAVQKWATRKPCDQSWLGLKIIVYEAAQDNRFTGEIARCGASWSYKV